MRKLSNIFGGTVTFENLSLRGYVGQIPNTICEGADERLYDERDPKPHPHDASEIQSGVFDIDRIPKGAGERFVIVENQDARFNLTTEDVSKGDTVHQEDTGVMYYIVDTDKLDSPDGYKEYTAGTASAVEWEGVKNKPSYFPVDYATKEEALQGEKTDKSMNPYTTKEAIENLIPSAKSVIDGGYAKFEEDNTNILIRADVSSEWESVNPTLKRGEMGLILDTQRIKVGDGITKFNDLEFFRTEETDLVRPTVKTLDPDEVSGTSAILVGEVTSFGSVSLEALKVYFEYREKGHSEWTQTEEYLYDNQALGTTSKEITGLTHNTEYEYRVIMFDSVNSGVFAIGRDTSFFTKEAFVKVPTLTVQKDPEGTYEAPTLETSSFSLGRGSGTHESTTWRVKKGEDTVWNSTENVDKKTSITLPDRTLEANTEYTFEVIHHSEDHGDSDLVSVTATTNYIKQPTNIEPEDEETDVSEDVTLKASGFETNNGSDTLIDEEWRIIKVSTNEPVYHT